MTSKETLLESIYKILKKKEECLLNIIEELENFIHTLIKEIVKGSIEKS